MGSSRERVRDAEFTFHLRRPDSESALAGGSLTDLCAHQGQTGTTGDSPGQTSAVWGRQAKVRQPSGFAAAAVC